MNDVGTLLYQQPRNTWCLGGADKFVYSYFVDHTDKPSLTVAPSAMKFDTTYLLAMWIVSKCLGFLYIYG